jgi:hypothetical protein
VLGLYLVYTTLFPAPEAAQAVAPRKKTTKSSNKTSIFTQEDREAKFAVFTETPKNAFRPLVVKSTPVMAVTGLDPSADPSKHGVTPAFADGQVGWAYTGYVVLNGKPQALLENPSTGDALYVQKGDVWKRSTVREVTPERLVLSGAGGTLEVKLGDVSEPKKSKSVDTPGAPVAPVNPGPALRGAIGGGVPGAQANGNPAVPGTDTTVQNNPFNDLGVQPDQGFGRRGRGGRRNRGGGGFPNQ